MEHPFFPTTTTRAEALRWLTIAEKLLSTRDLMGSKSFATRARDADPTLSQADQILAVADTLLAGDMRIGNNQQDLYAILRLTPQQGRDAELVASQYRSLALLLNPQKNKFPFAEQAFRLVLESWSVLSNPSRKTMYDRELAFYTQPPQQQAQQIDQFGNPSSTMHQNFNFFGGATSSAAAHQPQPAAYPPVSSQADPMVGGSAQDPQNFMNFTSGSNIVFGHGPGSKSSHDTVNKHPHESYSTFGSNAAAGLTPGQTNNEQQPQENYSSGGNKTNHNVGDNAEEDEEDIEAEEGDVEEVPEAPLNSDRVSPFWTACPYCYYMYEYPRIYEDCVLRCQNCSSAFQAVVIPSPPPNNDGEERYFCCWGFQPLGFSMKKWEKSNAASSMWTPFSPMFSCPSNGAGTGSKNPGSQKSSAPRVYVDDDDDEVFVDLSDSSDSDDDNWDHRKEKKKSKAPRGKSAKKSQVEKGKSVTSSPGEDTTGDKQEGGESSKKGLGSNARKQPGRAAKNFGKLDLNVECSNEGEEVAAAAAPRGPQGSGATRGEDDNIEGNGFFEGLDEFLSSLPILNVVDDKVVKAA
ncbi:uncharacterized protein LOC127252387 [Andrographis paniculata]|uniref:uncharacterized protein LOC127252387 n=1 Tax=Andrographis paniculata TaxID=175694 RepID=UPI0021E8ACD7|nr:uncharacterized protein LOC127252387 [Andrographis paniculata]